MNNGKLNARAMEHARFYFTLFSVQALAYRSKYLLPGLNALISQFFPCIEVEIEDLFALFPG